MARLETMLIADWIRDATEKRRERWRREDRARKFARDFPSVYEQGFQDGYLAVVAEVYNLGFADAEANNPYRLPDIQSTNPHSDSCPVCGTSVTRPSTARDSTNS